MSGPTPHEARQLLERAGAVGLEDDGARRVHARVAVGYGVVLGVFGAVAWSVDDTRWGGVVTFAVQLGYLVAIVALARHRERAARTVPRRARRIAVVGVLGSGVPLLTLLWFVFLGDPPAPSPLLATVAGLVIAAPAVVAGARIRTGPVR
ncbi:hypothetical protein [Isoptericola sp. NPDC019482]|uniref:hypothetical protein n=1 Tax=Isoptericola sp. NPDC019482 TaxID=3154688 RepID=UPI003478E584